MRTWEFEDSRAVPSSLVREQDLILRVRRLQRLGAPNLAVNIVLSAISARHGDRGPLEEAQERLQKFAQKNDATYAEMSNGDVFLLWPENNNTRKLPNKVMDVVLPDGATSEDSKQYMIVFHMPADYVKLRERTNHYVDISRAAAMSNTSATPAQMLQSEAARGPLTAWSVDQIGKLLRDVDLNRYIRRQPVYEHQPDGSWKPLFEECFVSFDELRRTYFPHLDVSTPEHLFLDLCQTLDRRLLTDITENYEVYTGQSLSLNLSVASVMGSVFAQFARRAPRAAHANICFELHRADLLQDFPLTMNAMTVLHRESFKVAIDNVTLDMLNYLNVAMFETDFIKLNVAQERALQIKTQKTRRAIEALPREKLIFFHCDNEEALLEGVKLGITKFQGWLVDDLARLGRE